jgi:hypothetical protein
MDRLRLFLGSWLAIVGTLMATSAAALAQAAPPASDPAPSAPPPAPSVTPGSAVRNAPFTSATDATDSSAGSATKSPIAIGTLYGIAVPLFKPEYFRVVSGQIQRVRSAEVGDYFNPAVYVLPSVAIMTRTHAVKTPKATAAVLEKRFDKVALDPKTDYDYSTTGNTLAFILPAGVSSSSIDGVTVSIGVGFSYGHALSGAEVGFAAAVVWNQEKYLTDAQRASLGGPLPAGVSDQIDTRLRPSLALGLYFTPTF